jgi:dephospho-CoA kinase
VVLDIPLLFETGGEVRCDATAVVSAPAFVQRARVLARPGMTVSKYDAILARQLPDEEKRRRADFLIRTGLNKRVSEQAVRRIADILSTRRGTHWPLSWPVQAS